MRKQLHVTVSGQLTTVIDLHDDEGITVRIDHHPFRVEKQNGPLSIVTIDGGRWRDGKHHNLEWDSQALDPLSSVTLAFVEGDAEATPPTKEELYVRPEKECSFCHKKASSVFTLIEENDLSWSRICDECVDACYDLVKARRGAT